MPLYKSSHNLVPMSEGHGHLWYQAVKFWCAWEKFISMRTWANHKYIPYKTMQLELSPLNLNPREKDLA